MLSVPDKQIPDGLLVQAMYRALESERPDALFHDPYARLLAGSRGEEMIHAHSLGVAHGWTLVIRTRVFDDLILRMVDHGVDMVLNLASGLDTRPYRLPLPSDLHWIEVDRPDILAYKARLLKHIQPVCFLECLPLDILKEDSRNELFSRINGQARRILVVAEGLLVYMTSEQAADLARDLYAQPHFRWWLISLSSPYLLKNRQQMWSQQTDKKKSIMQFAPKEGGAYFRPYGWKIEEAHFTLVEAGRFKRSMPSSWSTRLWNWITLRKWRELARKQGGYILLERGMRLKDR